MLKEHEDSKWLTFNELNSVEWLPADEDLVNTLYDNYVNNQLY